MSKGPEYNFEWRLQKGLLVSPKCYPQSPVMVCDHRIWFNNFREHKDVGVLKAVYFKKAHHEIHMAQIPTRLARNQISTEVLKQLEKHGMCFVKDYDYNRTLMPVLLELGT